MSILPTIRQYIEDAGHATTHDWRYGRIWPEDTESQTPFIMLREMGEGESDIHVQRINVLVMIAGGTEADLQSTEALADDIRRLFRDVGTAPPIYRFGVTGGRNGPFLFETGKPYYEINITVTVEGY